MGKINPEAIDVVAIFNKNTPPVPHMFKWNGEKYYVDYIAEKFLADSNEGECYVYRCRSNLGEASHSTLVYVYELRYIISECKWVMQWMADKPVNI